MSPDHRVITQIFIILFYLKGKGDSEKSSVCWFTCQMTETARTMPGQRQKPGTPSRAHMWVTETPNTLDHHLLPSQREAGLEAKESGL